MALPQMVAVAQLTYPQPRPALLLMNRSTFLGGVSWGASLVVAGWVGKTYFTTPPLSQSQQPQLITTEVLKHGPSASGASASNIAETVSNEAKTKSVNFYADSKKAISERVNVLLQLDDPMERMSGFIDFIKSLDGNDNFAEAAKLMMENFDGRGRGRELSMLMTEWAKLDPKAALASMDKVGDWTGKYASSTVLSTWAKADPMSAKAWAMEKGKGGNAEEGNWYMVGVISGLAKNDLDLAANWAQEQPRSKARGEMMDKLVESFTKQRGLQAAQEYVTGLEAGPYRDGLTRKVAGKLIEKDPTLAAGWITGLPSGEAKSGAMADLVNRWSDQDPDATGNWLRNYPASKETDDPRQTFAWNIREKDPESAIAWAGTISDQKRRDKMLVDLVRDWSKRDKQGAQAYMVRNKWPDAAQKKAIN